MVQDRRKEDRRCCYSATATLPGSVSECTFSRLSWGTCLVLVVFGRDAALFLPAVDALSRQGARIEGQLAMSRYLTPWVDRAILAGGWLTRYPSWQPKPNTRALVEPGDHVGAVRRVAAAG